MKQDIVNMKNQRITNLTIHFPEESLESVKLSVKCKAGLKKPKDIEDNSVLLTMSIFVFSEKKEINIELDSETIFVFDSQIKEWDSIVEEQLIPEASKDLFKNLDDILEKMGYKKMNLAQEI